MSSSDTGHLNWGEISPDPCDDLPTKSISRAAEGNADFRFKSDSGLNLHGRIKLGDRRG